MPVMIKSGTRKREDNWVISLFVILHIGPFLHRLGFETDRFRTITPARERDHHKPCKGACQSRSLTAMHPVKRFCEEKPPEENLFGCGNIKITPERIKRAVLETSEEERGKEN